MRRAFVILFALATVSRAADRPNFLFVFTDDQRYDAMSVVQREQGDKARFPWLKTPNMDRLAAEGFRFRNAFVVNSLCAPSRATFLSGRYGHANGVVNNHTDFPIDSVTYATELRKAGYTTAYVGKWHMGKQLERPGFDFSASFLGQGKYLNCPIHVNGKETPSTGWVDDVTTDYAIEFIRKNKDRPFSVTVGFKATHGPFEPPPRRANDYEGQLARPVPNLTVPAIYRDRDGGPVRLSPTDTALAAGDVKTNLGYFRCITAADDNLGRLLGLLDELKLADNTLVIFASDNGYYLGEHKLGDKRSAYEESLRIPLLLRYPKIGGGNRLIDQMVLNIDLAPTLVDFGGTAVPQQMHGRSWRPLLESKPHADWRKAWFYCYFLESRFGTPMTIAVRTETAKLIKYPNHPEWTEMFDVASDPYELRNLYGEPAAADLRRQLEAEYDRQAKAIDFHVPDFADKPDTAPAAAKKSRKASKAPTLAPADRFVLDYDFAHDEADRVTDASGLKNDGKAIGVHLAEGREGRKARHFDGKGSIDVPKAPALDPNNRAWSVRASIQADAADGVVLARGGKTDGYCLYLKGGKPSFAVTTNNKRTIITGELTVTGRWVDLVGCIRADHTVTLAVDGQVVASGKLPALIATDPNDGMQIGADGRSPVVPEPLPNFSGLIESIQVYSGELK
ncbi:MAG TPA: sulfatase-like hydrolase/transferase [Verrucomicrobiae bacterium]|nr:sulfatase-like hydrolase/transferase [Verrucomicrobiae bacterium]